MAQAKVQSKKKVSAPTKAKLEIIKKNKMTKELLLDMYKNVVLSRRLDDAEITMKKQSKAYFQISGAGHEGILSAVAKVLKPKYDYFIPYYRDRALCTGLGVTAYEMLCQANGNVGDTASHGRQMPAHWGNVNLNIINKSSCTGTQFLQACGVAEAGKFLSKMAKDGVDHNQVYNDDEVVYVSTGDGTTSQGEFWEGLTTACVNKLPVMFMVEDNGFAISVPTSVQTPAGSISECLAHIPGLKVYECDGTDPVDSYDTVSKAAKYIREGNGPALVHAHVTRPYSHSLSDDHSFYRTQQELADEAKIDVVNTYPAFLIEGKIATQKELDAIKDEVDAQVKAAMKEAIDTPWPTQDTFEDHLYSMDVDPTSAEFETEGTFEGKDDIPMAGAINAVLKGELLNNPLMRMFGEDVADFSELEKLDNPDLKGKGGVFKVTSGCQRVAKEGQVFNSPLAEANIIGRAIGMAMRGIKPVVEIQFFDYIWTAYMQLKNEMATTRYRSGGDFKCPMVVRVPIGGYLKGGSIYHSQSGESLFTHIPGIRVAFPSNAKDAAGLLRTAIRSDDPVMFLEHKHLYYQGYNRTADPGDNFMIPFGKANIVKEGADATVVAWGALVQKSIDAAKKLEDEGYSVEVIDLRTLAPFDMDTIASSLSKTNRLMIAHEEHKTSGFAGEIAACVNETCFESLDAPILRVCSKDTHVAYCPGLEEVILPQTNDVYDKLKELLQY
ncbi:MAG: dehydrogenase E1 component subunit alpha/beta [Bacteriovoracaceae bacterium]|jgi:2-oxoisovalerate dehydrogenase E1 component|nr:dehydrogenase E1 component subunit alpha/beta [Bacteriovoracaceae bacterium]